MQKSHQEQSDPTSTADQKPEAISCRGPLIYPRVFDQTGIAFAHIRAGDGFWQHIDTNDERMAQVGPHYPTKEALLEDHSDYLHRAGWIVGQGEDSEAISDGEANATPMSSRALSERYPRKGSMPAAVVEQLYALRDREVQRLASAQVIRTADLFDLDRGARVKVASDLFSRCDDAAKQQLLNDPHHFVRSAAVLAQDACHRA